MANDEKQKNPRVYNFCGVIYEEHLNPVMDYLRSYTNRGTIRAWYIIKHLPEKQENDEEQCKVHWHVLFEFWEAKTVTSVLKNINKFGLVQNGKIQRCSDLREYARYLIHLDEIDKHHYNTSEVNSNDKDRYMFLIRAENNNQTSNNKVFLNWVHNLITSRYDLCVFDIYDLILKNPNFTASQLKTYSQYIERAFYSYRFHKYDERINNEELINLAVQRQDIQNIAIDKIAQKLVERGVIVDSKG